MINKKRQRSPFTDSNESVSGKNTQLYNLDEDVCHVLSKLVDKTLVQMKNITDIKILLNFKKIAGKYAEYPPNYPKAKIVLTVVRAHSSTR